MSRHPAIDDDVDPSRFPDVAMYGEPPYSWTGCVPFFVVAPRNVAEQRKAAVWLASIGVAVELP